MSKHILFNEEKKLVARYDSEIHDVIPEGAVEVSDETFWATIHNPHLEHFHDSETNQIISKEIEVPEESLEDAKIRKVAELKKEASDLIFSKYPQFKQINAALGLLSETKTAELKQFISAVIAEVEDKEKQIGKLKSVSKVDAVSATWPI